MISPSVMVLVKNEAYFLPYVLQQTVGHFDSYVIYNVGSTDSTGRIIDWWMDSHSDKTIYRDLPDCSPKIQGTFRNAMIVEGQRPVYFILDGDELYTQQDMRSIKLAALALEQQNSKDPLKRYGVVSRTEVNDELTYKYAEQRGHHRLYTNDAYWKGTHPGEVARYGQRGSSELEFREINCWHMHNTLRSPKEADATKRIFRKSKRTYHPGNKTVEFDLLKEVPMLREPIEDFNVSPALQALQDEYNAH